jgi:hypothetical protein
LGKTIGGSEDSIVVEALYKRDKQNPNVILKCLTLDTFAARELKAYNVRLFSINDVLYHGN